MSSYKLVVNQVNKNFEEFILNIQSYFKNNNNSIHKARNELKIINYSDIDTIVKSFKVPNILRRIVYTYFRDSKAKKSYEYSLKIKEFTPTPIGYIEFYSSGLIDDSYFISEKFNYDFTIREPLIEKNFENRDEVFKAFAKFTFELHNNDILHKDYSPGNILIKKENNDFIFKVVDINRMEFKELNLDERLKNFNKLWAKDEYLTIMIKEYAKLTNSDEKESLKVALNYSQKLKDFKNMKKRLKGQKVVD